MLRLRLSTGSGPSSPLERAAARLRALPDTVGPPRLRRVVTLTALAVLLVSVSPPGWFIWGHVVLQIGEIRSLLAERRSREEIRRAVLGEDYGFLSFVRERTPEDAIVLMSDQFAFSELKPLKGKSQRWATYVLYPRRVLYLHQRDVPWYRDATWLVLDGPAAVGWIEPSYRPEYAPGELRLAHFRMDTYLDLVDSGEISRRWLPPDRPLRAPKSER